MAETREMVTVTARKFHTHQGQAHDEGDTYAVAAEDVGNLVAQGMVSQPEAAPVPAKPSQPVEPMTSDSFKGKKK